MSWISFALLAALATGFGDLLAKFLMKKDDEFIVAWMRSVFIVPFAIVGIFLLGPFRITHEFWYFIAIIIPVDILAYILYLKAIRQSQLSLALPFLAFSPIFVIFNSWIILGEKVSRVGLLGILLIVFGSYVLNIKEVRKGFFAPVIAIFRWSGPRLMLMAAFMYGLDAVLGKKMILLSQPKFMALAFPIMLFLAFTPIVFYRVQKKICTFNLKFNRFLLYFLLSFVFAIIFICHFKAVSLTHVAYAISVKRVSILVGSVLGFLVFKERNVLSRLVGIVFMLAGVFIIGFYA
ncbi:MAG: DMT family transporter [Candidatus Margulisbacteria bacterium]|nr:DMT family transporter [Candidatus Margulisiibacteriota bacterium]MBU1022140.1 DMT family transporter [Candidatus Margulisiibacteriota bacterium]MBU1729421.1 DMT family transporter [Candidatus Margulisiibacteriota bacterium]MBU1955694.1 DMT family transporter [Candidatus Margulisiibacteriota bacterium]